MNLTLDKIHFSKDWGFKWRNWNKVTGITKSLVICRLPRILTIYLKRFSYDGVKNKAVLDIPKDSFNIGQFVNNELRDYTFNPTYDLIGVVSNKGEFGSRDYYYYCQIKNLIGNKKWYKWDDKTTENI